MFLMWNVPYAVALWHPRQQRTSLGEALVMQAIGLLGEMVLLWSVPAEYALLRGSATRFILFDGTGLLLLVGALWLARSSNVPDRADQ